MRLDETEKGGKTETLVGDGKAREKGVCLVYLAGNGGGDIRAWLARTLPPRRLFRLSALAIYAFVRVRREWSREGVQGADGIRGR